MQLTTWVKICSKDLIGNVNISVITFQICNFSTSSGRAIFKCRRKLGDVSDTTRRNSKTNIINQRRAKFRCWKNTNEKEHQNEAFYILSRNNQQDATLYWNLLFQSSLKSQHVLSGIPLIISSSKLYLHPLVCIPMWWPAVVKSETWLRPVTTCACKPQAANTVRAPDDERYAARNMLSCQWTVE